MSQRAPQMVVIAGAEAANSGCSTGSGSAGEDGSTGLGDALRGRLAWAAVFRIFAGRPAFAGEECVRGGASTQMSDEYLVEALDVRWLRLRSLLELACTSSALSSMSALTLSPAGSVGKGWKGSLLAGSVVLPLVYSSYCEIIDPARLGLFSPHRSSHCLRSGCPRGGG